MMKSTPIPAFFGKNCFRLVLREWRGDRPGETLTEPGCILGCIFWIICRKGVDLARPLLYIAAAFAETGD